MAEYILVVDDEQAMRYAVRSHLEGLGYEVAEAPNGLEALKSIAKRKPDLMVLDVIMQPVTGWEVLKLLHDSPATRNIRVLLLTALGHEREETYGWLLGCDWYAVKEKPLQFEDLGLVVRSLLAVNPEAEREALLDSTEEKEGTDQ